MSDSVAGSPSVAQLLRGYSIEVNPKESKVIDVCATRVGPGTEVFLTWIPGEDPMLTVPPAAKLKRDGLNPVPHIGARHIQSAAQLEEFSAQITGEAGVDRVLIIGGDREQPAGPYDSSLKVMESGILQKHGIRRMAIGAFPEGNPNIPDPVLHEALIAKVNFGRSAGLDLSIVTQFCFAWEPIVEWLRHTRSLGIDVPVRLGLAGPASIVTLTRYAIKCGVGNSLRVLTEKPTFARLLTDKGPEPLIRGIAAGVNGDLAALKIAGLHFFVFGGFHKTVDWINATRAQ